MPDPLQKAAGRKSVTASVSYEPLQRAWTKVKHERLDISFKELALAWGISPGAVSQYYNGHAALNVEAQLWFARYLEIAVTDIWPDFKFRDLCPGKLPPAAIAVARHWATLAEKRPSQATAFADLIRSAAEQ